MDIQNFNLKHKKYVWRGSSKPIYYWLNVFPPYVKKYICNFSYMITIGKSNANNTRFNSTFVLSVKIHKFHKMLWNLKILKVS